MESFLHYPTFIIDSPPPKKNKKNQNSLKWYLSLTTPSPLLFILHYYYNPFIADDGVFTILLQPQTSQCVSLQINHSAFTFPAL